MKKSFLAASSAALIAIAGCGSADSQSSGSGSETTSRAAAMVAPGQVSPQQLQAAVSDERVRSFYEARNWEPAWTSGTAPGLLEALEQAERHALDSSSWLADVQQAGSPAAVEAALSLAAFNYADGLANGQVNPNEIREIYTVPRPDPDLSAGLNQALQNGQVGEWLASLAPGDPEYQALSEAYLRYREQAASEQKSDIQSGDLIREGDSDPRVPRIVEALRANGYLQAGAQPQQASPEPAQPQQNGSGPVYTAEIAAAVERMQEDYGISVDGVVGPGTLAALNTGAAERARTLAVNLERRRWLERQPPATRIDVNTAAAVLDYWRDGQHRDQRKVIVGQPGWETPQLGSPIFRLVANPTWTVPKSIEEDEIAPKGPGYLRRNNMVRRDGWIVQQPGPDNALGQVKLDMQNDHAIYLHDTPAVSLFNRNQRHFSHGCVRVENAEEFARMLAEADGKLSEFNRAMATGKETFVNLDSQVPVRLVYHTAFVDQGGNVVFRTDPYGWDEAVAQALGYEAREGRRLETHISDIGP